MAVAWHSLVVEPEQSTQEKRAEKTRRSSVIEVKRGSTTVKIYPTQNRGRTLFMVTWFLASRRHRRNFRDEATARAEAARIASQINKGQGHALSLTGADRDSYLHAKALLTGLAIPLHVAVQEYATATKMLEGQSLLDAVKYFQKHSHGKLPARRVKEVFEEFLRQQQSDGRSIRYLQDIRSRLGRFADAFNANIASIHTSHLDEWIRSLGVSGRTRMNFRTLLITFFKFAQQAGYLPKNVPTAAEDLSTPRAEHEEILIYSVDEFQRLISHADEATLPVLCLGAFAGLRTAEIERLNWDCLNWKENFVEVKAKSSKTRTRRLIPLLPPLRVGLSHFRNHTGAVVSGIKLQYRLRELAKRAKVPRKANALRHSFASYRVSQLQHVEQVALEMGNSPSMIFQHYRQLVSAAEAARWWNPDSWDFPKLT